MRFRPTSRPSKIAAGKINVWALLKEFFAFAKQEKKWWLIPLVIVLLLLGVILVFAANSGIAWALYPFL